jgi:hypothetical protein
MREGFVVVVVIIIIILRFCLMIEDDDDDDDGLREKDDIPFFSFIAKQSPN